MSCFYLTKIVGILETSCTLLALSELAFIPTPELVPFFHSLSLSYFCSLSLSLSISLSISLSLSPSLSLSLSLSPPTVHVVVKLVGVTPAKFAYGVTLYIFYCFSGRARLSVEPDLHVKQYPERRPFKDKNDLYELELIQ